MSKIRGEEREAQPQSSNLKIEMLKLYLYFTLQQSIYPLHFKLFLTMHNLLSNGTQYQYKRKTNINNMYLGTFHYHYDNALLTAEIGYAVILTCNNN